MLTKAANFWLLFLISFVGVNSILSHQADAQIVSEQITEQELSNTEIIDNWTDHFFELLRPEFKGKEIPIDETFYQKEKAAIAQVITHIFFSSCQQENHYFFIAGQARENNLTKYPRFQYPTRGANSNLSNRNLQTRSNNNLQRRFISEKEYLEENKFSYRNYFFEGFYRDLTNAVFYARHPDISVKKNKLRDFNLATEWDSIRRHFSNYDQEKLLKKNLIPVCNEL